MPLLALVGVLCASLLFGCPNPVRAQSAESVVVFDSLVASRLTSLEERSDLLRAAMFEIRQQGIPVRIGTAEQIITHASLVRQQNRKRWVGVTAWEVDSDSTVVAAFVAVDIRRIAQYFGTDDWYASQVLEAIDQVLIHEIYGHLDPVIRSRSLRDQCADPIDATRKAVESSCAIQRENTIRRQLRMPPVRRYH